MELKIVITEEDIFNYVLNPSTLAPEKSDYIRSRRDEFKEEINYYEAFKIIPIDYNAENIAEKVRTIAQQDTIGILLFPTWKREKNQFNGLRLAAASTTLEKKFDSFSFADKDSKFLIRITSKDEKNLLYVFPNEELTSCSKCRVKFFPSGTEYEIKDFTHPIEIEYEDKVNSISITEMEK
jgi:hypothetical protein